MSEPSFDFPFLGAGQTRTPSGGLLWVRFAGDVPAKRRAALVAALPAELREAVEWQGPFLTVVLPPREAEDGEMARVTEDWLRAAHAEVPIVVALRHDGEAAGSKRSAWHRWSLSVLDEVIARVDDGSEYTRAFLESVAALADGEGPAVLDTLRYPAGALVAALDRSDVAALAEALELATARGLQAFDGVVGWQRDERAVTLAHALSRVAARPLPMELVTGWAVGGLLDADGPRIPASFARVRARAEEDGHGCSVGVTLFHQSFGRHERDLPLAARMAAASAEFEHPERIKAFGNAALWLAQCGDLRGCFEVADAGLVWSPSDVHLLDRHLGAAIQLGCCDEVTNERLERAAACQTSDTLLLNTTAVAAESRRYELGRRAVRAWESAHGSLPGPVHLNAVVLHWGLGDFESAEASLESAARVGDISAPMLRAVLQFHLGNVEAAVEGLRIERERYPHFDSWGEDHILEAPRTDERIDRLFQ